MKKAISLALSAAMVLSLSTAVSAADSVLVSWYTFGDVYLTAVREALDASFEEKGFSVNDRDSNGNQTQQTEDINTAVLTGTNAVVVNLVDSGAIGTAQSLMSIAQNADLPVVFFNRAVSQDNEEAAGLFASYEKSCFVGTDFEEAGKLQGQMVGEYLVENYDKVDLNGDGVISYVMFKGDEANQEAIARTKYGVEVANEVLVEAGKPELAFYDDNNSNKYLVDTNGTWSSVASNDYMQTILAQYSDANGNMIELVIANNDDMAIGAINALQGVGYNTGDPEKTIPVFGVDAVQIAKDAIAEGTMTGSIKQDAEGMADAVATIAANMAAGNDKYEGLNEKYKIIDGWFVQIPYAVYTGE